MSVAMYHFRFDSTGFPLIYIPTVNAYVHFLPITKIQIEYFMSATTEAMFDESWYTSLLSYSERVSPAQVNKSNFTHLFVTGILPREAQRFASWAGRGYSLLTSQEWRAIHDYAASAPPMGDIVAEISQVGALKPRVRAVLEALKKNTSNKIDSLADQMHLTNGILDFVYEDEQQNAFVGHGYRSIVISPTDPQRLANSREGARIKNFGFRLICKE
ncbi:MAG: hypothetical protein SH821_16985 [Phototrophicales bacterium]|nr:hypothetical protein [Phototrophicales bacterium]